MMARVSWLEGASAPHSTFAGIMLNAPNAAAAFSRSRLEVVICRSSVFSIGFAGGGKGVFVADDQHGFGLPAQLRQSGYGSVADLYMPDVAAVLMAAGAGEGMQQFLNESQQRGIPLYKMGLPKHWETHPLWK